MISEGGEDKGLDGGLAETWDEGDFERAFGDYVTVTNKVGVFQGTRKYHMRININPHRFYLVRALKLLF
jgi:hypothetical protein